LTTALQGAELDVLSDDSEFVLSHLNHPTDGPLTLRGLEASVVSSEDTYRTFAVDRTTKPTVEIVLSQAHPEIGPRSSSSSIASRVRSEDWNSEHRLLMPAGVVKHRHVVAHAVHDDATAYADIQALKDRLQSRVAGPFGAAGRLGVPASTLESKIKALQIDKRRFKPG
jgi:hypothetical protein